jgi:uncharacterized BrkB/YihY/UPF0761 family membrane protein
MIRRRRSFFAALRRVVPDCITQSQAIAFNMFFAFFPMMLLVLGVVASSSRLRGGVLDIVRQLGLVFPPGAQAALEQFLTRSGEDAWGWISLGSVGTLLAGTQMMRLMIEASGWCTATPAAGFRAAIARPAWRPSRPVSGGPLFGPLETR